MTLKLSRRPFIAGTVAFFAAPLLGRALAPDAAWAQAAGGGLLERLRQAKSVKVGVTNDLPWSGRGADGSVAGFAPTLVQTVMARLGVSRVEAVAGQYDDMIPGLQTGRWDIIGVAFLVTKARCANIVYADPVSAVGGAIAYLPAATKAPPKSITEAGKQNLKIGILAGSYHKQRAPELGVAAASLVEFPDNGALIDGLLAKRIDLGLSTRPPLREVRKQRNNAFEIVYPLADDRARGSAPAFRPADKDLHAAFQRELKAMKASGELAKLSQRFGIEVAPELLKLTAEDACKRAV